MNSNHDQRYGDGSNNASGKAAPDENDVVIETSTMIYFLKFKNSFFRHRIFVPNVRRTICKLRNTGRARSNVY